MVNVTSLGPGLVEDEVELEVETEVRADALPDLRCARGAPLHGLLREGCDGGGTDEARLPKRAGEDTDRPCFPW